MSSRRYEQVARAESTARTRRALLDAARGAFEEDGGFDRPLDSIAERAGVSTRTLLRHFGSREGLFEATISDAETRVARARAAPPGDATTAVSRLVDHYEEMGDGVIRRLAEAERHPAVSRVVERGKALHRRWVEEVFAPDLDRLGADGRERRVALLASVTDVHLWALLRRRYGLARTDTEAAIRGLVEHARGGGR